MLEKVESYLTDNKKLFPTEQLFRVGKLANYNICFNVRYSRDTAFRSHGDTNPEIGFGNGLPECSSRKRSGKLLFVARRHHSRDRVREWIT